MTSSTTRKCARKAQKITAAVHSPPTTSVPRTDTADKTPSVMPRPTAAAARSRIRDEWFAKGISDPLPPLKVVSFNSRAAPGSTGELCTRPYVLPYDM
jgi:hypothetical protein